MIRENEIRRRALGAGVQPATIEKDYVLCHALAAVADGAHIVDFRGGTALARVYWPDYRLSEDLDFLTTAGHTELEVLMTESLERARARTHMQLELEFRPPSGGYARSFIRWEGNELVLDINAGETSRLPVEERMISLPYSDLADKNRSIRTVALPDILGNKWYLLDDRDEPRDLYDLWAALCLFEVPFQTVADGFRARYQQQLMKWRLDRAKRLKANWDVRLAHQLSELPDFDDAWECVEHHYIAWEESLHK